MIFAIIGGTVYVAGALFTFGVLQECFPKSTAKELILPSMGWFVVLPIMIVGLGR